MGSVQREDTAFYAKRRSAGHATGLERIAATLCCEPISEDRSAENPHARFCGNREVSPYTDWPAPRIARMGADIKSLRKSKLLCKVATVHG